MVDTRALVVEAGSSVVAGDGLAVVVFDGFSVTVALTELVPARTYRHDCTLWSRLATIDTHI